MVDSWDAPQRLPVALTERDYVPIVLTRQGERLALSHLDPDIDKALTPVFVVHPIPTDLDTREPKKSVDEHLRSVMENLREQSWGRKPAFLDLRHLDTHQKMSDGSHPIAWAIRDAWNHGWVLAAVVWAGQRASDFEASVGASAEVGTTLCFRLPPNEWVDLGSTEGDARLRGLLERSGHTPGDVHLMIDVEDNIGPESAITAMAVRSAIAFMPHAREWRSVIVAGTAMPRGTAEVGKDNSAELPRGEWLMWRTLREMSGMPPTTFGDYLVQHPDPYTDYDPRFMDTSAQLRYTIARAWFVARGSGMKVTGPDQVHELAAHVARHPQFSGRGFSWGDNWIADCADRLCPPSGQAKWRQVTTNHHLTLVARQIATLVGS